MTGLFRKFLDRKKNKPALEQPRMIGEMPAIDQEQALASDRKIARLEPPQLIVGCARSTGQQRDHNEDAIYTMAATLASDTHSIPFGLFIIADGMGGHQHGEIASGLAVRAMAEHVVHKLYLPLFSPHTENPEESIQEIMQQGVLEAHQAVIKDAPGGGTTLTTALVLGDQLMVAHAGDSRAYLIDSQQRVQVITRDHSLVKRLEELGKITPDESAHHPQRNVLYRALGQGEQFEPDIVASPLPHGGSLFLCSDGLWGVVQEDQILDLIKTSPTPHEACQELVKAANAAGGPDNISAILVQLPQ